MVTVQMKLLPTEAQAKAMEATCGEFIAAANDLLDYMLGQTEPVKLTSSRFKAALPSAVKNEVCRAVQSIWRKYHKGVCASLPVLRKPVASWNNQNYRVSDCAATFPVLIGGKSERILVKALITDYQKERLAGKLGGLRITRKNGKWIAQLAVEAEAPASAGENTMGVDLGLKVPAVVVTADGKTRFCGNGRRNKYVRRHYRAKRRELGKKKKPKAIKKFSDKEQRWMKDQDHKVSRELVNFAIANNVGTIRLEQLQNIRQTARTSRKNAKNLHTWSFHRLAAYIEYKAGLAGIGVEYVDPKHTSQTCPSCGALNKANDRKYACTCGFSAHRDHLGAMNIIHAPVAAGKRQPA